MAKRLLNVYINEATKAIVKLRYDSDLKEYSCELVGNPDATYFTNDKVDAILTTHRMLHPANPHGSVTVIK